MRRRAVVCVLFLRPGRLSDVFADPPPEPLHIEDSGSIQGGNVAAFWEVPVEAGGASIDAVATVRSGLVPFGPQIISADGPIVAGQPCDTFSASCEVAIGSGTDQKHAGFDLEEGTWQVRLEAQGYGGYEVVIDMTYGTGA